MFDGDENAAGNNLDFGLRTRLILVHGGDYATERPQAPTATQDEMLCDTSGITDTYALCSIILSYTIPPTVRETRDVNARYYGVLDAQSSTDKRQVIFVINKGAQKVLLRKTEQASIERHLQFPEAFGRAEWGITIPFRGKTWVRMT